MSGGDVTGEYLPQGVFLETHSAHGPHQRTAFTSSKNLWSRQWRPSLGFLRGRLLRLLAVACLQLRSGNEMSVAGEIRIGLGNRGLAQLPHYFDHQLGDLSRAGNGVAQLHR